MVDRTLVFATNGRHSLRGLTQVNPQEFSAVQDDNDDLTYVVDLTAYLDGATVTNVTRTANGPIVTNQSNTTTTITTRLKWFGYVDFLATLSSGDSQQFRINILPRENSVFGQNAEQPIQMPLAYTSTLDPTRDDDSADGHIPGTLWINTATLNEFICISNAAAAARWRHKPRIFQGVGATITGTTSETESVSIALPGGLFGASGRLEIVSTWLVNNDASGKTARIRFGVANDLTGTQFLSLSVASTLVFADERAIQNLTTGTQISSIAAADAGFGLRGNTLTSGTIDTTLATYLVFSGQLTDSADSIAVSTYKVTLTRPDIA
jgi:hypothetical protein